MTISRRLFLGSALPLGALGAQAFAAQSAAQTPYGQAAAAAPATDIDKEVALSGDTLPRSPLGYAARLQDLVQKNPKAVDTYLVGGAVAELEAKFSALLGKEDTVFMPTGTMANHIALRLLCGESKHALVQQESHVYRDESDTFSVLSGINLVPLAAGKAAPTLAEVGDAIHRAESGRFPLKVGAISIESPVRRADGATVPAALIADMAKLARAKGIPMHLDGARLLLMCGNPGFDVKTYCQPFETVYVSLYKYLGAPYGAVLSGPKAMMAKARELRYLFGGMVYKGWETALPVLAELDGIEQRYAAFHAAGERLLARLDKISGYKVHRVENASNIHYLEISEKRQAGLAERLKQANIRTAAIKDGRMELRFNESLLRRDTDYLMAAFAGA